MKIEELRIPAPWGHIAAKTWNDESSEVILVLHGFMDNAGSFDNLIPRLPKQFYYVCIDLPGHGLSDHFHKSTFLMTVDYMLVLKVLIHYFKRSRYSFIGHSYGGQLAILFSQLYPEYVAKLVILDAITFKPVNFFHSIKIGMDLVFENMRPDNKKVYTYEEGVEKVMKGRAFGRLDKGSAENIAKRALKKIGENEYIFGMDIRLKERLNPTWELDYVKETHLKFPVKCPAVFLFFNESPFTRIFKLMYEHLREREFEIHHLAGHHDYHITNPDVVVPIITEFLLRNSKL